MVNVLKLRTFSVLFQPKFCFLDNKMSIFEDYGAFNISSKLSPLDKIFMKCQILFSGKNKKNISICHLQEILPRELNIRHHISVIWLNIIN